VTEICQDVITGLGLAFTAYAATNLDNLLVLCGLIAGGARRGSVAVGFAAAGSLIILLASSFIFLSYVVPPGKLSYLGVVPIVLGLRMLIHHRAATTRTVQAKANFTSVSVLLIANSSDTIGAFAPMLAESESIVRLALVGGYIASAVILFLLVLGFSRRLSKLADREKVAHRVTAVIMICVGAYVLLNTGTDLE